MKILILVFTLYFSFDVFAQSSVKTHREHEAHVHGAGTLAIAFDDLVGHVEFKAASEGVLGFEHNAKSEADQKELRALTAKFENEISKFVIFEPALNCRFSKEKIAMILEKVSPKKEKQSGKIEGEHSDFVANFKVVCEKSVLDSKLTIDFSSFSKMKDLDVTVLVGDLQKNAEAKLKLITIELKK